MVTLPAPAVSLLALNASVSPLADRLRPLGELAGVGLLGELAAGGLLGAEDVDESLPLSPPPQAATAKLVASSKPTPATRQLRTGTVRCGCGGTGFMAFPFGSTADPAHVPLPGAVCHRVGGDSLT